MNDKFRCGYVAIIGKPNVGKSTLLNRLIGQKISITSRKPQTTRHRILGIKTQSDAQIVYVDTPGIHQTEKQAINRYMNRIANSSLTDVDVILFVTDCTSWGEEDEWVLAKLKQCKAPVILVLNKVDKFDDKSTLLPQLQIYSEKMTFTAIIPVSAEKDDNLDILEAEVIKLLPVSPPFFPDDQITDRSKRFLIAELIREKVMRTVGQEVPYAMTVEIEEYKKKGMVLHLSAIIWVEREGQKSIIIGKEGMLLKKIARQARLEIEALLEQKIFLRVWIKVKGNWSDDDRALKSLGYHDYL